MYNRNTIVERTIWFTKVPVNNPVDLTTDPDYAGRVQNVCVKDACNLTITDLRVSDSAQYQFRFITNQPGGSYSQEDGVNLRITGKVSE